MVRRSFAHIVAALALGLGLTLGLVWLLNSPARGLAAALDADAPVAMGSRAPDAVHTVCPAGPPTCDYAVIQEAVDAAGEGDEIRVAGGIYTGVNDYGGLLQHVYISKSLSLQGGYTTTNWAASNPISYPTTLDAQGQGRVIVITGSITVSIAGVRITGGDTAGLPSSGWGGRNGAGLLIGQAAATVDQCSIFGNQTAAVAKGAGVYVTSGDGFVFSRNDVYSNTVSGDFGFGAGLYVEQSDRLVIISNTITGNRGLTGPLGAGAGGGGLCIGPGTGVLLSHNVISDNHVAGAYGGVAIWADEVTLSGNVVANNSAGYFAGGLGIDDSEMVTVSSNLIVGNRASGLEAREGAGVVLFRSSEVTFTNNVVADNRLITGGVGSGVYVKGSQCHLLHNTIARNGGGDGSGIHIAEWDSAGSTVSLTTTILVSQTVGITVSAGSTATMEATLWGSGAWANGMDWGGDGTILTGTVNVWGDPAFVDPDSGDYHIALGSAAIDAGVDAGVPVDMDGEPRPVGMGYDIGADEYPAGLWLTKSAFPDPVQAGGLLTYTIQATNNGLVPLTVTLTDVLPVQVAPTGLLTWTLDSLLPGDSWTEKVVVTVETGYSGPLTNVVQATTVEGFSGAYTLTTPAYLPVTADFTAVPTTGVAPLTVTFANLSTGSYGSSLWDLGDGVTSTLDSPTHIYSAGLYTVTLSVSGPGGSDSETKVGYIAVYEPPTAEFSADPTSGPAPLTVSFANLSTGDYDTCAWDFGDGIGFSNSCGDPSYEYTTVGVYTVTLSVGGLGGSDSDTKVGYITVRYASVIFLPVVTRDHPPVGEDAAGQYRSHLFDRSWADGAGAPGASVGGRVTPRRPLTRDKFCDLAPPTIDKVRAFCIMATGL